MSKKKSQIQEESDAGQQMDLIDVSPKNSKEIINCAKRYKTAQQRRIIALTNEVEEKQRLLDLIKKENLSLMEGGKIKFRCDGYIITVTPRDELVRVKEENEKE